MTEPDVTPADPEEALDALVETDASSGAEDELEDSEEHPRILLERLDLTRLSSPGVWRHVVGLAVAVLLLAWPGRTEVIVGRLIGLGVVVYAVGALGVAVRTRQRRIFNVVASIVAFAVGVGLVVVPLRTEVVLGRVLGAVLVTRGLVDLVRIVRRRPTDDLRWRVASSLAVFAAGAFLLAFPSELISAVIVLAASSWIVVEILALVVLLDPGREERPYADTRTLVADYFARAPNSVEHRQTLFADLLFEGRDPWRQLASYVVLMVFAGIIASFGVASDSTAVVVGAMLIAPLMTPLMGMALSLVMGWPNRLARTSLIALTGVVIAIGIGVLIGAADLTIIDTATNGQITSRTNPTLIDLGIAVAAGGAGAFALSRPDVSSSLPGAAIAIALVPPLAVVGISYSQRDWDSGNGALLLFLTNALAILFVGGVVFLFTGVSPLSRAAQNQHRVRTSLAALFVVAALVTGALLLNGANIASNVFEQQEVQRAVDEWIEPFPNHSTLDVTVVEDTITVVVAGPRANRPEAGPLADAISDRLGRQVRVQLRVAIEAQETAVGS